MMTINTPSKLSPGACVHPSAPTTPPANKKRCVSEVPGAPQRLSRPVTSDGICLPLGRPFAGWFPIHPDPVAKKLSF